MVNILTLVGSSQESRGFSHERFKDFLYIVLLFLCFVAIVVNIKVKKTYDKYSKVLNTRGITGKQAAEMILRDNDIMDVSFEIIDGKLSDYYNPKTKVIALSQDVYDGTSVAAIGVACHEAGHAVQHAKEYVPIKLRNAVVPVCNISQYLGIPLAVIGLVIQLLITNSDFGYLLMVLGVTLYSMVAIFHLVTLPVELNASHRAMDSIEHLGILTSDERVGAREVLKYAAMTYLIALLMSIINVLRIALIFLGGKKN